LENLENSKPEDPESGHLAHAHYDRPCKNKMADLVEQGMTFALDKLAVKICKMFKPDFKNLLVFLQVTRFRKSRGFILHILVLKYGGPNWKRALCMLSYVTHIKSRFVVISMLTLYF
jgi:hypothetical protein